MARAEEQRRDDFEDSEGLGFGDPRHDFWYHFIDAIRRPGGQVVNPTTARRVAAVYACTTAISESVAMLPVHVYRKNGKKREIQDEHPLQDLLNEAPNPWSDSFVWFEFMQNSALYHGNAYSHVLRAKSGKILQLTPLPPEHVVVRMGEDRRLKFAFRPPGKDAEEYDQEDVFHFCHHSQDGLVGRSVLQDAPDVIAYALSILQHGNNSFKNGTFLAGLIKAPFAFKDDAARKDFVDSFKKFLGKMNAGGVGLLEQGTDYMQLTQNNQQSQFTEAKKESVIDIARLFRMPPHMIQDLAAGASYSSIEHQSINFVTYTIQPWIERWERAIKRQLLRLPSEKVLYCKFNVNALLRGDKKSRVEALVQELQYGLKTINEARALEDENPIEHDLGDVPMVSHNLRPIDQLEKVIDDEDPAPEEDPTDEDPVDPPKPEDEEEKDREFLPLFEELLGRVKRREIKQLKTAGKKGPITEWAEAFYPKHRKFMAETLLPACMAIDPESEDLLRGFLDSFESSRRELIAQTGGDAEKIVTHLADSDCLSASELLSRLLGVNDAEQSGAPAV